MSPRRSTRDRPAKAPLSVDAVVDAALAILASEGLDAVTMRRVAAALDTGVASLYVYVPGRDGLLAAVQDRIVAAIELEAPDPRRWREQLHALLERLYRAWIAHPGIAATTVAGPLTSETSLLLVENMLGLLLAGGLDPQRAAWGTDIFGTLVTYAAIEADSRRIDMEDMAAEVRDRFAHLPADRFPLLTTYAAQMVAGDSLERFRFAVDVVLDGMAAS